MAEYGVVAPQGRARIRQLVGVLEDGDFGLPGAVVELAWLLLAQIDEFDEKIDGLDSRVPDQRAGRRRDGTLLRMAVSVFVLADADAVITDADRTPEFYARAGLPANESSLHFRQDDGFVHALDLRTINRPEWRNLAAELAFRAMGFHTLRHVGTADHLHVSLRLPE